ncbi:hypothetical protein L7F22_048030 [Adiantum nelumboides]|nr:hypothetical protein [Adiantum nelumboides]
MASGKGQSNPSTSGDASEDHNEGQGYLWLGHWTPDMMAWDLAKRSKYLWEKFAQGLQAMGLDPLVTLGFKKTGSLLFGTSSKHALALQEKAEALCKGGVQAEFLNSAQLMDAEPQLHAGAKGSAVLTPDDCQIDANLAASYILGEIQKYSPSGRFQEFFYEPVMNFLWAGEVKGIQTNRREIYCNKKLVMAAGAWSGQLMQSIFDQLSLPHVLATKPRKSLNDSGVLAIQIDWNTVVNGISQMMAVAYQAPNEYKQELEKEKQLNAQLLKEKANLEIKLTQKDQLVQAKDLQLHTVEEQLKKAKQLCKDTEFQLLHVEQAKVMLYNQNQLLGRKLETRQKQLDLNEEQLTRAWKHKELIEQSIMNKYFLQTLQDISTPQGNITLKIANAQQWMHKVRIDLEDKAETFTQALVNEAVVSYLGDLDNKSDEEGDDDDQLTYIQIVEQIGDWWEKCEGLWKEWIRVINEIEHKKTVKEFRTVVGEFEAGMHAWKRHMQVLVKHTNALLQLHITASKIPEKQIDNLAFNEDTYREIGEILFEVLVKEPEVLEQTAVYRIIKKQTAAQAMEAATSSQPPVQPRERKLLDKDKDILERRVSRCSRSLLLRAASKKADSFAHLTVATLDGHLLVLEGISKIYLKHGLMEYAYKELLESLDGLGIASTVTVDAKGRVLLGSSRQFAGFDYNLEYDVMEIILKKAANYLPALASLHLSEALSAGSVRVGHRPSVPDGRPMIGEVAGLEGLLLATGHEGEGFFLVMFPQYHDFTSTA